MHLKRSPSLRGCGCLGSSRPTIHILARQTPKKPNHPILGPSAGPGPTLPDAHPHRRGRTPGKKVLPREVPPMEKERMDRMSDQAILAIICFIVLIGFLAAALMRAGPTQKPTGPNTKAIIRKGTKCPLCGATNQRTNRRARKRM